MKPALDTRRNPRRGQLRLIADTVMLGVVGALAAQLFLLMLRLAHRLLLVGIGGYAAPSLSETGQVIAQHVGANGLWLIPVVTTLGGLVSGLLVYTWAPEAEGHGTDTAVKAFHRAGGFVRARVAPLKMVASAITIGSGGAAGREGPTALISAGIGSIYATWLKRSDAQRRLLVLIGMAAGLSAIFRSPLGTAIFAIEVLYGQMEFEVGALLYTMLGAIVAYAVNGLFEGWEPLFHLPAHLASLHFTGYLWYVALGVAAGPVAAVLPEIFYRLRDAFHAIPIPPHLKPALGGLGVGLMALWLPQVLGGGYGWIELAINGHVALGVMLVLVVAKMVALALTISSGGSGGVFAPSLFIGAMLGSAAAVLFHQPVAVFTLVGMAAVFGGAARVPIATTLMVSEMTGGYELLVPAALAVTVSYLLQVAISSRFKYRSLYEAQVPGRWESPAHHAEHLRAVQRLLRERKVELPPDARHVDLQTLLDSGLAVDLPDGQRLVLGALDAESEWNGLPATVVRDQAGADGTVLAAIVRGEDVLPLVDPVTLRVGDHLLAVTSAEIPRSLREHLRLEGP